MPKVNLPDIGSLANQTAARTAINQNFTTVENAFDNTLSRNGATPNQMGADFDMNDYYILNVKDPLRDADAVNLRTVDFLVGRATGTIGSQPQLFTFVGDGVETDFTLVVPAGSTHVVDPTMYDTAIEGVVQEPYADFTIVDMEGEDSVLLRFVTPPANLATGFTVLRGFAQAYQGDPPLTTVSPDVNIIGDTNITINGGNKNSLIITTSASPVTISIAENTGAASDWKNGDAVSIMQYGDGAVTIELEGAGTLYPSPEFLPATRGINSIISVTCMYPDSTEFAVSGDLLLGDSPGTRQVIQLIDNSTSTVNNTAVGVNKTVFVMPYNMKLSTIENGGVYAMFKTTQSAGALLTIDVNRNGVSILTTKITVDNNEYSSLTAATPAIFAPSGTELSKGDVISIDVDQIGTALAKGLIVCLVGQPTA